MSAHSDVLRILEQGPLFEGSFDRPGEAEAIRDLIECGAIERLYQGASGFMGLAQIRLARASN